MAFNTDYASFVAAVPGWADWTNSTTTQVHDLIAVGETKLLRELRVRQMEASTTVAINASGQAPVPADYIEMKNGYLNTSPLTTLERVPLELLLRAYPNRSSTSGKRMVAREGANFVFGGAGAGGDQFYMNYYAKPVSIVSAATINSLFSEYPDAYLFATLSELEPYIGRDARIQLWQAKFQEVVNNANEQDRAEWLSGSPLAAKAG